VPEGRLIVVSIDTEVDKGPDWKISNPVRFTGSSQAITEVLLPLCERYGVKPTFLLSSEVIEHHPSAQTFRALGGFAELGTHLHSQFVEPQRTLFPDSMAGADANAIQNQYPPDVERQKLQTLTQMFRDTFGRSPTAFRSGRYAMSSRTLEFLAGLGYRVDSSVTPGIRWCYEEGPVDFSSWSATPRRVTTNSGPIVELPITIHARSRLAPRIGALPQRLRTLAERALFGWGSFHWLRPSWSSGAELIGLARRSQERILVMTFHNIELVPGASPYAQSRAAVDRIVSAMDEFFDFCQRAKYRFCGMTEAAEAV
jgi:peptidoglycan/xylan/chitin deacetylase (PgdA/CDA1 family)